MRPADGIDTRVSKGRTLSPYISVGLSVGLTISNLYNLLVSLQVFLSIFLLVGGSVLVSENKTKSVICFLELYFCVFSSQS